MDLNKFLNTSIKTPVCQGLHRNPGFTCIFYYFVYSCMLAILTFQVNSKTLHVFDKEESCAVIQIINESEEVKLYENLTVPRTEFLSVREGSKLENALFFVRGNNTGTMRKCVLEICGFGLFGNSPYDLGTCEWYHETKDGEPIEAPSHIYAKEFAYEVTSLTCACNGNYSDNCKNDSCLSKNDIYTWKGSECAILFQEDQCQSCYFNSTKLDNQQTFCNSNTYEIKSMIIRPGCRVERTRYGNLFWGWDLLLYTNYTGVVDYATLDPNYHQDSANFTCFCPPDSTPTPPTPPTTTTTPSPTTPFVDDDKGGPHLLLIIVFSCVGLIAFIVITILLRRFWLQRNTPKDEPGLPTAVIELYDKIKYDQQTLIMEEVRKIVGSIFGTTMGQDDDVSSVFENTRALDKDKYANNDEFTVLKEKFLKVCSADHILCKNAFTIPTISKENPLGEGQFGTVHKGYLKTESDGLLELVAIKIIKWPGSKKESVAQSFLREIKTFESIGQGNEFIVEFLGACCQTDGLFIITRFCEGGSLKRHLLKELRPKILPNAVLDQMENNPGDGYLDTDAEEKWLEQMKPSLNSTDLHQLICWCEQIASGMEYLSSKGIIHVDLAARNVLLSKESTVKICDFGLSKKCLSTDYTMSLVSGSFPFSSFAPEFCKENGSEVGKVSLFVDIWAFGCTIWEMFTLGDSLYAHVLEQDILKIISIRELLLNGYRHPKPLFAPDLIYQKMLECWSEVPKDRPSFTYLKQFFETTRIELTDRSIELEIS